MSVTKENIFEIVKMKYPTISYVLIEQFINQAFYDIGSIQTKKVTRNLDATVYPATSKRIDYKDSESFYNDFIRFKEVRIGGELVTRLSKYGLSKISDSGGSLSDLDYVRFDIDENGEITFYSYDTEYVYTVTDITGYTITVEYYCYDTNTTIIERYFDKVMNYVWWKVEMMFGNPQLSSYYRNEWSGDKQKMIEEHNNLINDENTKIITPYL